MNEGAFGELYCENDLSYGVALSASQPVGPQHTWALSKISSVVDETMIGRHYAHCVLSATF